MAGSRTSTTVLIALLSVWAGGLASCGGVTEDDLVEAYQASHPEVGATEAGCVVDALVDIHGIDGLAEELEAQAETGTIPPSFELDQFRAEFGCGLRESARADLEAGLRAQGYDDEEAACAAEALVENLGDEDLDVLLSGAMTDEFYERYFLALESCGAIP